MTSMYTCDADILITLHLTGFTWRASNKGKIYLDFFFIELIPWPCCCYNTLLQLSTFVSSLFQRFTHINLNRFTYWGMVLLETILLLCKSGNLRNIVKETQNTDHSYRETVDLHVLESVLCMNDKAVHVLLLIITVFPLE